MFHTIPKLLVSALKNGSRIKFPINTLSTQAVEHALQQEGSTVDDRGQNVLADADFFGVHKLVKMKELFDARVHLGHREGSLDERMKPYLFGSRLGHLIIDLEQTVTHLKIALNVAAHIAYRDGVILWVGGPPHSTHLIEQSAAEINEYAHTRSWRQGTFTNSTMLFGAMTRLPDLCIVFSTLTSFMQEHPVIGEAAKMAIPTIGIVDSNSNPNIITYPVPGNDDTPCAIKLYCELFKQAILIGKEARKKRAL